MFDANKVTMNQSFGAQMTQNNPFEKQLTNVSGKAQMAFEEASKSLMETIKDKAYHIINKFEEVLPKGQPYAEWEQFKQVMFTYTKNEEELA
jgi:hypothetical protein